MEDRRGRERDLVLAPNEFAFISDETKGNINVYVGPHKTSLANTDQPTRFNEITKRFENCSLEEAVQIFLTAPEGWYIVLKNPAKDDVHPNVGTVSSSPDLIVGHKVNIRGPVSFPLWPGQMARVVQGHHLRSNQYLIVHVYDEESARKHWKEAVIKPQTGTDASVPAAGDAAGGDVVKPDATEIPDLTMGKLLVIKGTDVSFYIPPTGIAVVPDPHGEYVRNAVTLERLEYCILLDEDGNKRYVRGPAVVFPRTTETFLRRDGSRKFKAIELNEITGLYLKVIADYEEDGKQYKVGDELFITGKDQMIYFPRPEHAIIKYGQQERVFAVAVPAGEARYVLDRLTGKIDVRRGPCMLLTDPRKEVIVRRILDPKLVRLWFPGNQEALEYNLQLMELAKRSEAEDYVTERELKDKLTPKAPPAPPAPGKRGREKRAEVPKEDFAGDDFARRRTFTKPRTVVLSSKYEGVVSIDVWTGYAVLVVSKSGNRKVVVGPQTYLLEYDEFLESMELSTGTPKTDEKVIKTVYLRVKNNKISDIVVAETKDLCQVRIHLSYRVNFEDDPNKWFDVENYVKFLTDHLRSLIRNVVKQHGVEDFYANSINILRDAILGTAGEGGGRPGRTFAENGMRVYDAEILDVRIGDDTIARLLIDAQHEIVRQAIETSQQQNRLKVTQETERINQAISEAQTETRLKALLFETSEVNEGLKLNLAQIVAEAEAERKRLEAALGNQEDLKTINAAELERLRARQTEELRYKQEQLNLRLTEVKADVEAVVEKAKAVSPDLIATMQAFADRELAARAAETMAPLAILGGKSVADVLSQLLKGTVLERALKPR